MEQLLERNVCKSSKDVEMFLESFKNNNNEDDNGEDNINNFEKADGESRSGIHVFYKTKKTGTVLSGYSDTQS